MKNDKFIVVKSDSIEGITLSYNYKDYNYAVNLDNENVPYKDIPDFEWVNNDYACSMTWWSQSLCRMVFLPLKPENKFVYIDKDIEQTDSIYNNIVYVDTVYKNSVVFAVENLLTRKKKKVSAVINDQNWLYPYYDSIIMTRDKVIIKTLEERIAVDTKNLY